MYTHHLCISIYNSIIITITNTITTTISISIMIVRITSY